MKPEKLPVLTALRGLAAWWVVCYHFREALGQPAGSMVEAVLSRGYLAVDFFFVLSGFVIFISYADEFEAFSSRAWRSFMLRRFGRIYPLAIVMLVAYLSNPLAIRLFSSAGVVDERYALDYFIASVFLVQNWGFFDTLAWNIPAWSISTEWAAYLLFPFILPLIRKAGASISGAFMAALVIAGVLAWVFHAHHAVSIGNYIGRLGVVRCVFEFSLGMMVGQLWRSRPAFAENAWAWIGGAAALVAGAGLMSGLPDHLWAPALFFLGILFFSASRAQQIPLLSSGLLVWLGEISYSTYLAHYFVKDWVKFLSKTVSPLTFCIYLAVVLAASVFLYHCVEKPGQAWIRRLTMRSRTDLPVPR